ncbi:alpha/beta hydrolase fold domain-containing protein [Streptomyces sp. NPDC059477]|uniref:alpha/beta hydrolase fold domain-containing protein n=1 Tax=Streptomyces sp. NPDC059477 TaxID=3346847 RepID=UPI003682DE21
MHAVALPSRPRPGRRTRQLVALVAAAAACLGALVTATDASGAERTAPAGPTGPATYTTHADLPYAAAPGQTLDLYVPDGARKKLPLVVYVHGGGWFGGDKSELQRIPGWDSLVKQGFAVASVNYTLVPGARFPQQIHEVKAAIRYLRAHASGYRLSGEVGLWGGSAGGQIAALVGTSCGVPALEGSIGTTGPSSCVDAVVDLSGPHDLTALIGNPALDPAAAGYLGCPAGLASCAPEVLEQANPITHLASSRRPPAFLLGHGDADTLIPLAQSQLLFSALKASCGKVGFFTLHGQDHFFPFSGALSEPYPERTVQTSRGCGTTRTGTEPPLSFTTLASFFRTHLR